MKPLTFARTHECVLHLHTFSTALPVSWACSKCLCCLYSLANIDSFLFERVISKCRFGDISAISVLLTFVTLSRAQMLWLLQEGCSCPTVMGLLASLCLFHLAVSSRYQPQMQMACRCMTWSAHSVSSWHSRWQTDLFLWCEKPWKWSHSLSLCKQTRQSWATWNRFLFMKPQTVRCKNNLCHMCKASGFWGVSPQLYTLRAVHFTQEVKCHCMNMCICAVLPACTRC